MILDVDPDAGTVELVDPDVLTRFHVAVQERSDGAFGGVDAAVRSAGAGRLAGHEVLVSIAWVRGRGRACASTGWEERFDGMVDFSADKGWVEERVADADDGDETGAAIPSLRVHCEWPVEAKFAALDFTRTALRESRWRAGLDRYTAPDLVTHGPAGTPDLEGQAEVLADLELRQVAGSRLDIRHVIADAEMVAVHAVATRPDATGGSPTVDIYRVSAGRIREWWRVGG